MTLIIIGIATAFNFIIIVHKFRTGRIADGILDTVIMAIICRLFIGTFSALTVGMIASMLVSFYLFFNPVRLPEDDDKDSSD